MSLSVGKQDASNSKREDATVKIVKLLCKFLWNVTCSNLNLFKSLKLMVRKVLRKMFGDSINHLPEDLGHVTWQRRKTTNELQKIIIPVYFHVKVSIFEREKLQISQIERKKRLAGYFWQPVKQHGKCHFL